MTAPDAMADALDLLPPMPSGARTFWSTLIRMAPTTSSVGVLAETLGVNYTTLNSRFVRRQLPSPKDHLVLIRLELAARRFASGETRVATVSFELGYATPQSFGRHLRLAIGITPAQFRASQSPESMRARWLDGLVRRHAGVWATFDPIE